MQSHARSAKLFCLFLLLLIPVATNAAQQAAQSGQLGKTELQLGDPSTAVPASNDDAAAALSSSNPIDEAQFFVRQNYLDFLNREADASGLAFWVDQINQCGIDAECIEVKRINVSAAFFFSIEFHNTGYLVYRLHQAAFNSGENLRLGDFLPDSQAIRRDVIVGRSNWEQQLADGKPPGSICGPEDTNPCTNYGGRLPSVADGEWHHIAATVQVHGSKTACPEVGKLYVDGNLVSTFVPRTHSRANGNLPGSDIGNTADLYIGRRAPAFSGFNDSNAGFFNGLLDELEFFRTSLSQEQIRMLYNAGSSGKCKR